jgi:hypothetical protein
MPGLWRVPFRRMCPRNQASGDRHPLLIADGKPLTTPQIARSVYRTTKPWHKAPSPSRRRPDIPDRGKLPARCAPTAHHRRQTTQHDRAGQAHTIAQPLSRQVRVCRGQAVCRSALSAPLSRPTDCVAAEGLLVKAGLVANRGQQCQ